MKEEASRLMRTHIRQPSSDEVNIPSKMRSEIEANFKGGNITADLFLPAEKEIFVLMSRDSFARFKAKHVNDDIRPLFV